MSGRVRALLIALSIVVSALAITLWVRSFDVTGDAVAELIAGLRWWALVPILALLALHVALAAWRWSAIETALGGSPGSHGQTFRFGVIALALGTFLPPPLVYVACRGLANRLNGTSPVRGAISGAIDQGADFAVVLMMAVPAVIALLARDLEFFLVGASIMAVLGFILAIVLPRIGLASRLAANVRAADLLDRGILLRAYAISLLRMINLVAITLMILVACDGGSATAIIIGVPLVTLAISVAMLPGAIGVSEWSFTAVFAAFGLPSGETVTFVLANRLLLTGLALLLGGIVCAWMAARQPTLRIGAGGESAG